MRILSIAEPLVDQVSTRRAEVILAQFFTGHTPTLHPVRSHLDGTKAYCPHKCRRRLINDVDHYVFRCPARAQSRRKALLALKDRRGMTVEDLVQRWPEKVLAFPGSEGFVREALGPCRN